MCYVPNEETFCLNREIDYQRSSLTEDISAQRRLSKIWLTRSDPLLCLAAFDSANLAIFYEIFTNLCSFLESLGAWKGSLATEISSFDRAPRDDRPVEKFIEVGERTPRNSSKNPHLRYPTFSAKASTNEKQEFTWNSVSSHGTQKHSLLFLGSNDRFSSV